MFISKFIVLYKMKSCYSEWNLVWLHINPLINFRSMLTLRSSFFLLLNPGPQELHFTGGCTMNSISSSIISGPSVVLVPRQLKRCNYGSLVHALWVPFPVQAFPALLLSRDPVHNNDAQWQHSRCDLKHLQQFWFDP